MTSSMAWFHSCTLGIVSIYMLRWWVRPGTLAAWPFVVVVLTDYSVLIVFQVSNERLMTAAVLQH